MKSIVSFYKESIVGIGLLLLPFVLPRFGISNVGSLVTPTSALFAIVAGFFIADAMANYLRLQTLISEENATLIAMAHTAKKIDKQGYKRVYEAIDHYMVAQLNVGTLAHVLKTQPQMDSLTTAIDALRPGRTAGGSMDHIVELEEKMHLTRQEVLLTTKKTLTIGHWFTLILFGGLVTTTVLSLRDGSMLMNVVAGLMNVGTFAVLVLLRDIDNNRLLEGKLAYQNPRDIFEAIGRPPFYPCFSPPQIRLPNAKGVYRLGKKEVAGWDLVSFK